jgi:hypothetical protein
MSVLKKARLNIMKPPQATTVSMIKKNLTIKVSSWGLARELERSGWTRLW